MLIAVDEEVLDGFEIERKWRNHINNSNMLAMHKDKQALKEKLEIAIEALEEAKEYSNNYFLKKRDVEYSENTMMRIGCIISQATAKIKEIK